MSSVDSKHFDRDTRQVQHAARIIYEEVNLYPSKVVQHREGGEWVVDEVLEWEESDRTQVHEEVLIQTKDESAAKSFFEEAISRYRGVITKGRMEDMAIAIAYGFNQPDAEAILPMFRDNIVSEMVHSMNRKNLIANDDVDEFIALIKRNCKTT